MCLGACSGVAGWLAAHLLDQSVWSNFLGLVVFGIATLGLAVAFVTKLR